MKRRDEIEVSDELFAGLGAAGAVVVCGLAVYGMVWLGEIGGFSEETEEWWHIALGVLFGSLIMISVVAFILCVGMWWQEMRIRRTLERGRRRMRREDEAEKR